MATIVNQFPDTRFEDFGKAIGLAIGVRRTLKQKEAEQQASQALMSEITSAGSREKAFALASKPEYSGLFKDIKDHKALTDLIDKQYPANKTTLRELKGTYLQNPDDPASGTDISLQVPSDVIEAGAGSSQFADYLTRQKLDPKRFSMEPAAKMDSFYNLEDPTQEIKLLAGSKPPEGYASKTAAGLVMQSGAAKRGERALGIAERGLGLREEGLGIQRRRLALAEEEAKKGGKGGKAGSEWKASAVGYLQSKGTAPEGKDGEYSDEQIAHAAYVQKSTGAADVSLRAAAGLTADSPIKGLAESVKNSRYAASKEALSDLVDSGVPTDKAVTIAINYAAAKHPETTLTDAGGKPQSKVAPAPVTNVGGKNQIDLAKMGAGKIYRMTKDGRNLLVTKVKNELFVLGDL